MSGGITGAGSGECAARELNLNDIIGKLNRAIATGYAATRNAEQALDTLVGAGGAPTGTVCSPPQPTALLYVLNDRAEELQTLLDQLRSMTVQFRERLEETPTMADALPPPNTYIDRPTYGKYVTDLVHTGRFQK